ncbi:hypothetical protein P9J83_03975 [Clostridium sporogenes]|uniref:Uncharacterized protein n=1 Tax=Clostridium sporogenes TaxID=1509 RepID=A0AAE4JS01_CLOSG|nr:hypothetical protein [Clostridium sporogenes]MDS1002661.1 hypothetical protein [Clostridium sporogenes]
MRVWYLQYTLSLKINYEKVQNIRFSLQRVSKTDKRTEFQGIITFIFNSSMNHSLKGEDVVELYVDKNAEKACLDTCGNYSETKQVILRI